MSCFILEIISCFHLVFLMPYPEIHMKICDPVLSSVGLFVAIAYIVWVKIIDSYVMPKIIRILY